MRSKAPPRMIRSVPGPMSKTATGLWPAKAMTGSSSTCRTMGPPRGSIVRHVEDDPVIAFAGHNPVAVLDIGPGTDRIIRGGAFDRIVKGGTYKCHRLRDQRQELGPGRLLVETAQRLFGIDGDRAGTVEKAGQCGEIRSPRDIEKGILKLRSAPAYVGDRGLGGIKPVEFNGSDRAGREQTCLAQREIRSSEGHADICLCVLCVAQHDFGRRNGGDLDRKGAVLIEKRLFEKEGVVSRECQLHENLL